jgi:hypothetical protein
MADATAGGRVVLRRKSRYIGRDRVDADEFLTYDSDGPRDRFACQRRARIVLLQRLRSSACRTSCPSLRSLDASWTMARRSQARQEVLVVSTDQAETRVEALALTIRTPCCC